MEIFKHIDQLTNPDKNTGKSDVGFSDLLHVFNLSEAKRVNKPWGFEIWIADGSNGSYAFKIIGLKEGTKTSLQYHEEKSEHNFLLSGTALLHYEHRDTGEIVTVQISEGTVINVNPPAIHRVEALTDLILIETSTPQLDDVVRIGDDYNRPDGKIESEHTPQK